MYTAAVYVDELEVAIQKKVHANNLESWTVISPNIANNH